MADHFLEVSLPPSVEHFLLQICELHDQPLPDAEVRWALASVGEVAALDALHKISCSSPVRNLSGFILHMVRKDSCASPQNKMVRVSPHQSPSSCCRVSQLQSPSTCSVSLHQSLSTFSVSSGQGLGTAENASFQPPTPEKSGSFSSSVSDRARISQFVALGELEFRKAFLLLSYIGGESLERVTTAEQIQSLSQLAMEKFEDEVWKIFGKKYITNEERRVLPPRTIQIRDSMIKVEIDPDLVNFETENSLELVGTSNPPKRTFLSRNLIALLNYGGVPREYFMTILVDALKDVQGVFSSKRAALRVSINNGEMDDFLVARMILAGIPLDESYLQYRLSVLLKEEKKSLKSGRLHVPECYYLMGTVDPTCTLESGEVCVILENGQINGKVLVYRNPGLHLGDIHVLTAKYVEELVPVVGNAKYAIFFSSKGPRSVADEIAGGDFDGDMYWVSRNSQLLEYFRPCEPWRPSPSTEVVTNRKPKEFSVEELENELFKLFLSTRFQPSYAKSVAADNWLALMDQFLMLGEERKEERNRIRAKILQLINIYYDALDAPKKGGKKIEVPKHLKAGTLPHFMERGKNSYVSTSILGQIFDTVNMYQEEVPNIEVQKLPCFEEEVPEYIFMKWKFLYELYRKDMVDAMQLDPDAKNIAAEATIKKYKEILYGAEELEGSPRSNDDVYQEALAIYQVTYDHAMSHSVRNCVFAWKVAGSALFKLYAIKHSERSFLCLPSVMREIFS
ncbi:hypothetical protein IC575_003325 [Cucumis melo]